MSARETYAKLHANTSGPNLREEAALEAQVALDEIDELRAWRDSVRSTSGPTIMSLPRGAFDDYLEYLRHGGQFDVATWWDRYKDEYARSEQ